MGVISIVFMGIINQHSHSWEGTDQGELWRILRGSGKAKTPPRSSSGILSQLGESESGRLQYGNRPRFTGNTHLWSTCTRFCWRCSPTTSTPIAGWLIREHPAINGWELGGPLFQEISNSSIRKWSLVGDSRSTKERDRELLGSLAGCGDIEYVLQTWYSYHFVAKYKDWKPGCCCIYIFYIHVWERWLETFVETILRITRFAFF